MSRARRLLAVLAHGVVGIWIAAALSGSLGGPGEPPPSDAIPEQSARVQPRAVAPPAPVAKAPPRQPAPAPAALAPRSLGAAEVAEGDRILDSGGDFPVLSCSYEAFDSFARYSEAMTRLGARFVVVQQRRIVASLDPASGQLAEPAIGAGFSPRARDYTGEPALAPLARAARERFGSGAVVMMLVPRRLDAGLFGGISRALADRGDDARGYREISGRYERGPGGGLRLRVDRATRLDGSPVALDLLFDLDGLAASPAA